MFLRKETGSTFPISELSQLCRFRSGQFYRSIYHVCQCIGTKFRIEYKFGKADFVGLLAGGGIGNKNYILEMCRFRFTLAHWIDSRSTEHSCACLSYYQSQFRLLSQTSEGSDGH